MKILISAYACEPNRGSEPHVGWQWALGLARRGHEVWVLTRSNNRHVIEEALAKSPVENLSFEYFDLPRWGLWLKKVLGVNVYYRLWQMGAYSRAKALQDRVQFDRAHHVTFVVARHPSFLRKLGIPYVFGPVSGGEHVPKSLLLDLPLRFRLQEWYRTFANRLLMSMPSVQKTLQKAQRVAATSVQTASYFPADVRARAEVKLAITSPAPLGTIRLPRNLRRRGETLRVLFVGRLLHWKGVHLAILALARLRERGVAASMTIVGSGAAEAWLRDLVQARGLGESVNFVRWMPRDRLSEVYAEHDVFLFPSFRDSGGMVVLEAMQHGMPVVCLALGGPAVLVDDQCGAVVQPTNPKQVVDEMADALARLASDPQAYAQASSAATLRPRAFSEQELFASFGY